MYRKERPGGGLGGEGGLGGCGGVPVLKCIRSKGLKVHRSLALTGSMSPDMHARGPCAPGAPGGLGGVGPAKTGNGLWQGHSAVPFRCLLVAWQLILDHNVA